MTAIVSRWLILAVFLVTSPAHAAPRATNLPHFIKVNSSLYRGGRPTEMGIKKLSQLGVKIVINLENVPSVVKKEKAWVESYGMTYYSFPTDYKVAPKTAAVQKILALLADPERGPLYIHCKHGEDRTGLMMGLYRVFYENWSVESAYQEMLDLGFHPQLKALDDYFYSATKN